MVVFFSVPTPTVSVTSPNNQTVGQPLILQCEVTTVRGITSRVDIVWSSNDTELQRMDNVVLSPINDSLVYMDTYNNPLLNTTDDGRVIQCEVVINVSPSVTAKDNITLDVTGKDYRCCATVLTFVYVKENLNIACKLILSYVHTNRTLTYLLIH